MNVPSTSQGPHEQKKKTQKVILITDEDCDQLVHELHLKDNGYSWIVLGALFAQCVIVGGFFTSFGIALNAFTDEFPDVSFTMIGLLMGLLAGFRSLIVPLVGPLEMCIGSRNVMIIGTFLFTFSLFVSILCKKLIQIALILGILLGLSQCLIESTQVIVLSQYFDSKLALANGIRVIGSPFGGIIYPAILTTIFQNDGASLSFLWLTGISLHLYICAFMIRPIQVQTQIRVLKTIEELFPKLIDEENDPMSSQSKPLNTVEEDKANINKAIKETMTDNISGFKTYLKDKKTRIIINFIKKFYKSTESENKATEKDGLIDQSNKYGATFNQGPSTFRSSIKSTSKHKDDFLVIMPICPDRSKPVSRKKSEKRLTRKELYFTLLIKSRIMLRADRRTNLDLRILKISKFYLFLFLAAGMPFIIPFVWYFTALYAKSIGLSPFKITLLFVFQAVLELLLRIILEWMNNKNLYSKANAFILCMLICGFGTILMPFGRSLTYLMSMTGFYTFGCASFHCCANAILAENFSKENETTTWGIFRLTQGFFSFIHPVYIGYIVDQTGEFKASFIVMGTIILFSGLIFFFVENVLHIFNKK